MRPWLERLGNLWRKGRGEPLSEESQAGSPGSARPDAAAAGPRRDRRSLLKDRPASLEDRYEIVALEALADEVFLRVKSRVYTAIDAQQKRTGRAAWFRESGRLSPNRAYFFLQPLNRDGILVERSGAGWVVAQARKIPNQNSFLRAGEVVDHVTLFAARDGSGIPRVKSSGMGDSLVALAVYEAWLTKRLGLGWELA